MSDNSEIGTPLFALGQVVATPAALNAIAELGLSPLVLIHRHAIGDWGELTRIDQQENQHSLRTVGRLFSSYPIGPKLKIWVITEADRSTTTLLLPEEY